MSCLSLTKTDDGGRDAKVCGGGMMLTIIKKDDDDESSIFSSLQCVLAWKPYREEDENVY